MGTSVPPSATWHPSQKATMMHKDQQCAAGASFTAYLHDFDFVTASNIRGRKRVASVFEDEKEEKSQPVVGEVLSDIAAVDLEDGPHFWQSIGCESLAGKYPDDPNWTSQVPTSRNTVSWLCCYTTFCQDSLGFQFPLLNILPDLAYLAVFDGTYFFCFFWIVLYCYVLGCVRARKKWPPSRRVCKRKSSNFDSKRNQKEEECLAKSQTCANEGNFRKQAAQCTTPASLFLYRPLHI